MSDRDSAYDHQAEIPGTQGREGVGPSKEHTEKALGNEEQRNELTPDQRGRTDGYGPRTHDDTRVTRKDGE